MTPSQNPAIQSIRQVLFDTAVGLKNGTIDQACANSIAEVARLFIQSFDPVPAAPLKNTLGIRAPDQTTEQNQTSSNAPCPAPDRQQKPAPAKPAPAKTAINVQSKQVSPPNAESQAVQHLIDQGIMEIFVRDFLKCLFRMGVQPKNGRRVSATCVVSPDQSGYPHDCRTGPAPGYLFHAITTRHA
jgi:hypothetical protein